jgi:hypothetical protein
MNPSDSSRRPSPSPSRTTSTGADRYNHLIPSANRALAFTAKVTWKMMKAVFSFAFRLPRAFTRANTPDRKPPAGK